jgi:hypothetical protein
MAEKFCNNYNAWPTSPSVSSSSSSSSSTTILFPLFDFQLKWIVLFCFVVMLYLFFFVTSLYIKQPFTWILGCWTNRWVWLFNNNNIFVLFMCLYILAVLLLKSPSVAAYTCLASLEALNLSAWNLIFDRSGEDCRATLISVTLYLWTRLQITR